MTDFKASYESDLIKIFKHSKALYSIVDKNHGCVDIRTPEDAKAIIQSMIAFLDLMDDCTNANF